MSGDINPTAKGLAHILTATQYIADELANAEEPEALSDARLHLGSLCTRVTGILSELRGITCDVELIDQLRDGNPALEFSCGNLRSEAAPDLDAALVHLVDLLITVQFHAGRLAEWKPESEAAE